MPYGERGLGVDPLTEAEEYGHTLHLPDRDYSSDVDAILGALDKQRTSNPDNQVLDPIKQNPHPYPVYATANPLEAQRLNEMDEMGAITGEIVKGILKNPDGMTIEQYTEYLAIQEANKKYMDPHDKALAEMDKKIEEEISKRGFGGNQMSSLEADIMKDIETTNRNIEAATSPMVAEQPMTTETEVVTEEDNFPTETVEAQPIEAVTEDTNTETLGEAVQMNNDMPAVVDANTDGDLELHEISEEEMENVPASSLEVSDKRFLASIPIAVDGNLSNADALHLLDIMKRYKNGEKFSVYDALPTSVKVQISSTAAEAGNNKRSTLEFLAKNLINSIVSDAFMSTEIDDFSKELKTYTDAMSNIPGVIVDSYSDELKQKFEVTLYESAEKLKDKNPETAEKFLKVADAFKDSHTFETIKKHIENGGDVYLNRIYKKTRKIASYINEFDTHYANVRPKIRNLASLCIPFKQMGISEEVAEMLIVLIGDSCLERDKGELDTNVYTFYVLSGIMNICMSAYTSDLIREINDNVVYLANTSREFLVRRERDPKYGGGKKGKKKRGR